MHITITFCQKTLAAISILFFYQKKNYVSTFFFTVQVDTVDQKFFPTHACFCFYVMEFRKQKKIYPAQVSEASLCFNSKK